MLMGTLTKNKYPWRHIYLKLKITQKSAVHTTIELFTFLVHSCTHCRNYFSLPENIEKVPKSFQKFVKLCTFYNFSKKY